MCCGCTPKQGAIAVSVLYLFTGLSSFALGVHEVISRAAIGPLLVALLCLFFTGALLYGVIARCSCSIKIWSVFTGIKLVMLSCYAIMIGILDGKCKAPNASRFSGGLNPNKVYSISIVLTYREEFSKEAKSQSSSADTDFGPVPPEKSKLHVVVREQQDIPAV
ncbi:hypothetical protein BV898_13760 [Hypsibius exemplaris]|uniref:Uncharacterized protein n=1 Tax=Hypsibius exemplaris TaxID=2072580 RepID=A0A1W0W9U2_HYPEX|nr:hypothetical protein BV898_13760 [Hypsibius exemplaris]